MESKNGYYNVVPDFEIFAQSCTLQEVFALKDINLRKFYLNEVIDQPTVHEIARHILQINREDAGIPVEDRKPIILYIASEGGELDSGFELIDVIESSITPVYTVNIAYAYSMAMLIGLAGHKRYSFKNATFLMHDGSNYVYNSGAKAQDQMDFIKDIKKKIADYILAHSKLTQDEYNDKLRVEWYLFAPDAKEKGFVDYIVGEDCSIEEVV